MRWNSRGRIAEYWSSASRNGSRRFLSTTRPISASMHSVGRGLTARSSTYTSAGGLSEGKGKGFSVDRRRSLYPLGDSPYTMSSYGIPKFRRVSSVIRFISGSALTRAINNISGRNKSASLCKFRFPQVCSAAKRSAVTRRTRPSTSPTGEWCGSQRSLHAA